MKALTITDNGNIAFVKGKGISLDYVGEETVESIDLSGFSDEEWEKIQKDREEISQKVAE